MSIDERIRTELDGRSVASPDIPTALRTVTSRGRRRRRLARATSGAIALSIAAGLLLAAQSDPKIERFAETNPVGGQALPDCAGSPPAGGGPGSPFPSLGPQGDWIVGFAPGGSARGTLQFCEQNGPAFVSLTPAIDRLVSDSAPGGSGAAGTPLSARDLSDLWVSGTGRFIVFSTYADEGFAGDRSGLRDVILYDRGAGETRVISNGLGMRQWGGDATGGAISEDGRWAVFAVTKQSSPAGSRRVVMLRDLLSDTWEQVGAGRVVDGSVGVSSDGSRVWFGTESRWWFYDRTSGDLRSLPYGGRSDRVSADGRALLTMDSRGPLVIDTSDGARDGVTLPDLEAVPGSVAPGPTAISSEGRFVGFGITYSPKAPVENYGIGRIVGTKSYPAEYAYVLFDRSRRTYETFLDRDGYHIAGSSISADGRVVFVAGRSQSRRPTYQGPVLIDRTRGRVVSLDSRFFWLYRERTLGTAAGLLLTWLVIAFMRRSWRLWVRSRAILGSVLVLGTQVIGWQMLLGALSYVGLIWLATGTPVLIAINGWSRWVRWVNTYPPQPRL